MAVEIFVSRWPEKELGVKFDIDKMFNREVYEPAIKVDQTMKDIINIIDESPYVGNNYIHSCMTDTNVDWRYLSTGCKTVLLGYLYPNLVFNGDEMGENALEEFFKLKNAKVHFRFYVPQLYNANVNGEFIVHIGDQTYSFKSTDEMYEALGDR